MVWFSKKVRIQQHLSLGFASFQFKKNNFAFIETKPKREVLVNLLDRYFSFSSNFFVVKHLYYD